LLIVDFGVGTIILVKRVDCARRDELSVLDESRETVVASVEAELTVLSEPPSVEFRVDAILCFDVDRRRKLAGRVGALRPGLKFAGLVEALDTDQSRPRNLDAAEPTSEDGEMLASKARDSL
jgi:hypothetical protein